MKYSVVTGDIANSTSIAADKRAELIDRTSALIKSWVLKPEDAEIFRGDSFQLLFDDVAEALKRSIQIRCWLKSYHDGTEKDSLDARLSIGVGDVAYFGKSVLDSDGEAFHLSGRAFDEMKATQNYFQVSTNDPELNEQLNIILNLANIIITQWTKNQAEVIFLLLEGKTQQEMADELKIAQSAVNNRIKLSRWKEIDKTMRYIASLM
ncbi:SatD family protein [Mucilaginibacter sp. BT774]|uniref:SatD family protein n=1 Tax=Mucilaginibacter sp. BT774 TaxID=3062276 RepID=UPI002675BD37|nr:SatD family protein [Mucilaginibacter sp. BT774]MDO3624700.1 SatD family protein [Mucilaginibacter sp. BT774]